MELRRRLRSIDWDAVAGIVAAVVALVLHFLHVIEEGVLLSVALVLLALLFVRDLRREHETEDIAVTVNETDRVVREIRSGLDVPDVELIGPNELRDASTRFGRAAQGEMIWFHVCLLMFRPQHLFDDLLKPAIENPDVTAIRFVLDESERDRWRDHVRPKIDACAGHEKVQDPVWNHIDESVSFIISGADPDGSSALLSFWGEPFMSGTTDRDVPRYIFRVRERSELITRFREIERNYRFQTTSGADSSA